MSEHPDISDSRQPDLFDSDTKPTGETTVWEDGVCPGSGRNIGLMHERDGWDDWRIECPECGTQWGGGSTVLEKHPTPGT